MEVPWGPLRPGTSLGNRGQLGKSMEIFCILTAANGKWFFIINDHNFSSDSMWLVGFDATSRAINYYPNSWTGSLCQGANGLATSPRGSVHGSPAEWRQTSCSWEPKSGYPWVPQFVDFFRKKGLKIKVLYMGVPPFQETSNYLGTLTFLSSC